MAVNYKLAPRRSSGVVRCNYKTNTLQLLSVITTTGLYIVRQLLYCTVCVWYDVFRRWDVWGQVFDSTQSVLSRSAASCGRNMRWHNWWVSKRLRWPWQQPLSEEGNRYVDTLSNYFLEDTYWLCCPLESEASWPHLSPRLCPRNARPHPVWSSHRRPLREWKCMSNWV